jgi:hypothetical protein
MYLIPLIVIFIVGYPFYLFSREMNVVFKLEHSFLMKNFEKKIMFYRVF